MRSIASLPVAILPMLCACSPPPPEAVLGVDQLAGEYLFLELSMGTHDQNHVDAYFGPDSIKSNAVEAQLTLDTIQERSAQLSAALENIDTVSDDMLQARVAGLLARLRALDARIAINNGEFVSFDEESLRLFGSQAPHHDAAHFTAIVEQVDALLPGDQPLSERVEAFNNQFAIPPQNLATVFEAAMDECRQRTLQHIDLPEG
ncbi:MAG: hypothetical protein WBM34_01695, partial [Woeseiaceae bacterium]